MKLSEYVRRRNGAPMGHPSSLRKNLERSLGARNFADLWTYWNPIFGFYLGKFIFKPLRRYIPVSIAIILTFVCSGMVHDLVTSLVRGAPSLFFTVWFLLMGTLAGGTRIMRYDLSSYSWIIRASLNLSLISVCLLLTICGNRYIL